MARARAETRARGCRGAERGYKRRRPDALDLVERARGLATIINACMDTSNGDVYCGGTAGWAGRPMFV